jgi:hypothetical protein
MTKQIDLSPEKVKDEIDHIIDKTNHILIEKTTNSENFMSLSELQTIWKNLKNESNKVYDQYINDLIENIDEKELISKKKNEYKRKGIKLRTQKKLKKTILTLEGFLTLNRYILRPETKLDQEKLLETEGKQVVVPLDMYLRIEKLPFKISPEMMIEIAFWAQNQGSYEAAREILIKKGFIIDDDTVRRVTNFIGNLVFENDCINAEKNYQSFNSGKIKTPFNKDGVLYIETDGATINTRHKNEEGSSWRENKMGVFFSSDNIHYWEDIQGKEQHKILKKEYTSYIGSVDEFKKHMLSCAIKNGYGKFKETVIISDGATWIRNMVNELFYGSQHILDFYHLCENVNKFAKELFRSEEAKIRPWADRICTLLKESQTDLVLKELCIYKDKKFDTVNIYNYITNNINNIDYATYIKKHYFIGSGAIESANKSVLQTRLKRPGQRWNPCTAQNIATLRAKRCSTDLWEKEVARVILENLYKK